MEAKHKATGGVTDLLPPLRVDGGSEIHIVKTETQSCSDLGLMSPSCLKVSSEFYTIRAEVRSSHLESPVILWSQFATLEANHAGVQFKGVTAKLRNDQLLVLLSIGSNLALAHIDLKGSNSDGIVDLQASDWTIDGVGGEQIQGELKAEITTSKDGEWQIHVCQRDGQVMRDSLFQKNSDVWTFKVLNSTGVVPDRGN